MAQGTTRHNVIVPLDACNPPPSSYVVWDNQKKEFDLRNNEGYICEGPNDGPGVYTINITLDPTNYPQNVSGEFGYARIECDAVTQGSYTQHQAMRTTLIWDSSSGDSLVSSTVEDVRYPEDKVIYDIKRVTGSFDSNGGLNFEIYQYDIDNVYYCLKYILL